MKQAFVILIGIFLVSKATLGQQLIDVTEQTIRLGGTKEEELFYSFAEGDKIIFNFEELNNKELKEVEIFEYPSNSRFSDFKTSKIDNKILTTTRDGVFVFRFKNSALSARICKIKIQRIPASELTLNFNTTVTWVIKQDTTWNIYTKDVIIGYDTTYAEKTRKELIRVDTIFIPLFDKTLRVHSETAIGKNQYTFATVELPQNTYLPNQYYPYKSTEVVCWTYWIGVGQKSLEEYDKANRNIVDGITAIGSLTGYGALASLAATGISMFGTTNVGDNVHFKFHGFINGQGVILDYGNVVTASGRNEKVKQGSFSVELFNDNFRDGIDVNLKMVVMQVSKTWEDIKYTEQKVTPRTQKQIYKDPVINSKKVPVVSQ